ncbi:MAG: hypothetical protein VB861_15275, partial [Planctomycetaceae bacterium]
MSGVEAIVLGTAQDGGVPQSGCGCAACLASRDEPTRARRPSCLGLLDRGSGSRWMIDATWQFASQLDSLDRAGNRDGAGAPDGILLTHAH